MLPPEFEHRESEKPLGVCVAPLLITDEHADGPLIEERGFSLAQDFLHVFPPAPSEPGGQRYRKSLLAPEAALFDKRTISSMMGVTRVPFSIG